MLIRFEIKATSDCEESNACIVQSVHGTAHGRVQGVARWGGSTKFDRTHEVGRVGPLSGEAFIEIDIIVVSIRTPARISVD